jgi:hypothetical protein
MLMLQNLGASPIALEDLKSPFPDHTLPRNLNMTASPIILGD